MVAKLASSTFSAGPREDLAAVDVYNQNGTTTINSIREDYSDGLKKGLATLRGGLSMLNKAKGIVDAVKRLQTANVANVMARVNGAVGAIGSGMRDMSALGQANFQQGIASAVPQGQRIIADIGGVKSTISSGVSFPDLKATAEMLTSVAGTAVAFKLNDPGAMVGSLSALVNQGTQFGLPNSFGVVMQEASQTMVGVGQIAQITQRSLGGVIASSDMKSLAAMGRLNSPGAVRGMYPGVLSAAASNYRLPAGTRRTELAGRYSEIKDTFYSVDTTWDTGEWGSDSVHDISALRNGSEDFQRVVTTGVRLNPDEDDKMKLLAAKFGPPKDIRTQLIEKYPQTVLAGNTSSSQDSIDPRSSAAGVINLDEIYPGVHFNKNIDEINRNYDWWFDKATGNRMGQRKGWNTNDAEFERLKNETVLSSSDRISGIRTFYQDRGYTVSGVGEPEAPKSTNHPRYQWAIDNGGITSRDLYDTEHAVYLGGVKYLPDGTASPVRSLPVEDNW